MHHIVAKLDVLAFLKLFDQDHGEGWRMAMQGRKGWEWVRVQKVSRRTRAVGRASTTAGRGEPSRKPSNP